MCIYECLCVCACAGVLASLVSVCVYIYIYIYIYRTPKSLYYCVYACLYLYMLMCVYIYIHVCRHEIDFFPSALTCMHVSTPAHKHRHASKTNWCL